MQTPSENFYFFPQHTKRPPQKPKPKENRWHQRTEPNKENYNVSERAYEIIELNQPRRVKKRIFIFNHLVSAVASQAAEPEQHQREKIDRRSRPTSCFCRCWRSTDFQVVSGTYDATFACVFRSFFIVLSVYRLFLCCVCVFIFLFNLFSYVFSADVSGVDIKRGRSKTKQQNRPWRRLSIKTGVWFGILHPL